MSSQQADAVIKQFAESRNDSSISVLEFIGILTIWIAMIAICNPIGNFPLNDDWAYADSVRKLLEGKIVLHDWTAANLFSQLFWGALFCKAFGFSYTTLRISSLVLGFIGILITYQLALRLSKHKKTAFALCILIAVNPIFFASSNTFMTEIPFFAFSLTSILFLTNAFRSSSWIDISVGTVFVAIAMLSRQIELAIPIAFAITYPINKKINSKTLLQASLPLAVCILTQILFKAWLEAENKIPFTYGHQIQLLKETLKLPPLEMAKIIYSNAIKSITLIAFFCSPFVFLKSKTKANTAYIITTIILSAVAWKYIIPHTFPITGNILNKGGIGPGSYEYSPSRKLTQVWTAIGVISTFASVAMIANFARYLFKSLKLIKERNFNPIKLPLFFILTTLIYLAPVEAIDGMYDRYFIIPFVTIPLFILSIESGNENKSEHDISRGYAVIFIGFLTIISTALVHDYLEWNREKWNSLNALLEQKIQPQEINGGFEFSGQYLYTNYTKNNKKGFWVIDDKYKVTTSTKDEATENYTILNKKRINTWLPMSIKYVYTLRRNN